MRRAIQGLAARWEVYESDSFYPFSSDVPLSVQRALHRRGVRHLSDLQAYFYPRLEHLPDLYELPDVEKALALLHEAVRQGQGIFIFGDYDVDGTVSVALVGSFLQALGHTKQFLRLPDRLREGYGVSMAAVEEAKRWGAGLFIALDCGTKDIAPLMEAHRAGMRILIVDHHAMGEMDSFPPADAFINPQRPDSTYPNRYPSAGALTYRLLRAYQERYGAPEGWEGIDLAAISLLADIMPLVGENRILVQLGLRYLQTNPRPGITALMQVAGIHSNSLGQSRSIVFQIVPRLNAPGRLHHPRYTLYLLTAQSHSTKLAEVAQYINDLNRYRQVLQQRAVEEALRQLEAEYPGICAGEVEPPPGIVVFHPRWHKGIVGLVASKLMERFYRPTVVLTQDKGILIGSARSPAEVPLYETLRTCCKPYLYRFGGHERAAGLSLHPEMLSDFKRAFVTACASYGLLMPSDFIDAQITSHELRTDSLAAWSERFEPIGPSNEAPRFLLEGLYFWRSEGERYLFAQGTEAVFPAFVENGLRTFLKEYLRERSGMPLSLVVTPRLSYNGSTVLRLRDIALQNPNP